MNDMKTLHDAEAMPSIDSIIEQTSAEDSVFAKGEAATIILYTDQISTMETVMSKKLGFTILPGTAETKAMYSKPSQFLSIATTSESKDKAADYINRWINDIEINKILLGRRGVPISNTVVDEITPHLDDVGQRVFEYQKLVEQYASPIDPPLPAGSAEVSDDFRKQMEMLLYGEIDVQKAAQNLISNTAVFLQAAN